MVKKVRIIRKEDFDKQVQLESERRMNIFLQQKQEKRLRGQLLKEQQKANFQRQYKEEPTALDNEHGADDTITSQDSGSRISDQILDELEGIGSKAYIDDLE